MIRARGSFELRRWILRASLYGLFVPVLLVMAMPAQAISVAASPAKAPERNDRQAEDELQTGIALSRQALFQQAIPHLLRARGKVADEYAANFNLALCYVGVGSYSEAIRTLQALSADGHGTAAVHNLLAQAYVGNGELGSAWTAFEQAVVQTPLDERLYDFVADACTDHSQYGFGLRVADLGLKHLPDSARLHYERAVFLARLDRFEEAKPEFDKAAALAPGEDIAYLARVQSVLYEDHVTQAIQFAREGIQAGHKDYRMLSLLGTTLLHAGAAPGQPEFAEAQTALEASVAARAAFSTSQIALGQVYLMENRVRDAVSHLEIGRRMEPSNPAVYTSLAAAYRRLGERQKSQECLAALAALLREGNPATRPNPMLKSTR
jgi:predicted Zn-dependent protease